MIVEEAICITSAHGELEKVLVHINWAVAIDIVDCAVCARLAFPLGMTTFRDVRVSQAVIPAVRLLIG